MVDGELEVLLCDNHLLAVNKPACLPVVPDDSGDESLLERAKAWLKREYDKPGEVFLGVVHRLDRPVSGVVLFARTSKAASRLSEQFRAGEVQKEYVALASGEPPAASGAVEQWLVKDQATNVVRATEVGALGSKRAVTHWTSSPAPTTEGPAWTRFDVRPETGRAHQIRVALASLGCPIVGDLKYGAPEALADRSIALHARALTVRHPTKAQHVRVECAPPARAWWCAVGARLDERGRGG
jgi:23S rRNA pseudouridine1911/1915/1917 synthase